jgi:hypothetical protein
MLNIVLSRSLALLMPLAFLNPLPVEVLNVDLKPSTVDAFDRYIQATESRIQRELSRPGAFLYVKGLPQPQGSQVLSALKNAEIYIDQLVTRDASGHPIEAPDGIIHHWIGAVFIPGATLSQTLALVQDYNRHRDIYKPEVVRSRLISRSGNEFKVYYRLRKKKVITVTLNTEHEVNYFPIDKFRCHSRSTATRIAEVVDANTPDEHEKPVGHDGGFLWRMNSYWRFEQKDGGVYVECESVSLTRDIPTGLGWMIRPFITGIPKESLRMTLDSTRSALEGQAQAAGKK